MVYFQQDQICEPIQASFDMKTDFLDDEGDSPNIRSPSLLEIPQSKPEDSDTEIIVSFFSIDFFQKLIFFL